MWGRGLVLGGFGAGGLLCRSAAAASGDVVSWPDVRFKVGPLLYRDDFASTTLANWVVELEKGGRVAAGNGRLDIDVPGGATVWFRRELVGPVLIEYDVVAVDKGGANDRVSDVNCFWMAQDPKAPGGLLERASVGEVFGL